MTINMILADKGTEVLSIDSSNTLAEAISVLSRRSVGILVATGPDEPLAGVISERDVVRAIDKHGAGVLDQPVSAFMSTELVTVSRETTVVEAMEIMTEKRIRHLPVMEGGKLCGLVSIGDVVKRRIMDTEAEAEALKSYIVAG